MFRLTKMLAVLLAVSVFGSCDNSADGFLFKLLNNKKRDGAKDMEFVENYLNKQIDNINVPLTLCRVIPEELEQRIDATADILLKAARGPDGDAIINGVAKMIRFDDLVSNRDDWPYRFTEAEVAQYSRIGRVGMNRLPGLTDILATTYKKPNIVTRQLTIDSEQFRRVNAAVEHEWLELSSGEQMRFKEALAVVAEYQNSTQLSATKRRRRRSVIVNGIVKPVAKLVQKTIDLTPRALYQLTKRVCQVGLKLMDSMFMAPEFIHDLPIIGDQLKILKQKGKPFYDMIEYIRHFHYLYKVTSIEGGDVEADPIKTTKAKQMIGELGMRSLQALATIVSDRISKSSLDKDGQQEFMSRITQALLVLVLPKTDSACTL